jgi:CubicO group peptidase (beta-lactamase class C family)
MTTELRYGTAQEAGVDPGRVEHIKALARGCVEDGVHPALVVLAARKGVIFLHEAYGRLRPGEDTPLPKDAIFPIASATKPVTAALVMMLVEEGKVGLMRPVREYFPEISREGTDEVLVHHLLTHLSGWRVSDVGAEMLRVSQARPEMPSPGPGQHRDIAAYLHLAKGTPLAHRPGEAMQYCGLNFDLLGDLVRRASGQPIEAFAEERLFGPMGMNGASYVLPEAHRARKVRRAEGVIGSAFQSRFMAGIDSERFEGQPWGARGMHANARDLAVFAQLLLNNGIYDGRRILSRASVGAMRRNQVPPGIPVVWELAGPTGEPVDLAMGGGYGYGLYTFESAAPSPYINGGLASASSFGHAGAYGTYWWADPERDLIGVYLSVALGAVEDPTTGPLWRADLFVDAVTAAAED